MGCNGEGPSGGWRRKEAGVIDGPARCSPRHRGIIQAAYHCCELLLLPCPQ